MFARKSYFAWCVLIASCYNPTFRSEESPSCGNGQIEEDELCDDGSQNGMYGFCNADCSSLGPRCGDDKIDDGEQCDDGSKNGMYGFCNIECLGPASYCGDGMVDETEECDDGNANNYDGCDSACKRSCGNGAIEKSAGEECDDGINNGDGHECTSQCLYNVCGDAFTLLNIEDCDDGNVSNQDACLNDCTNAACGDGYVQQGVEECDDGNLSDSDDCLNVCTKAICGDGQIWEGMEECDDGNKLDGDGCETDCTRTLQELVAGFSHTCALFKSGKIRCWGGNTFGALGYEHGFVIGDEPGEMPPEDVNIGAKVSQVTLGGTHTCALLDSGNVRCWGWGQNGRLGYGNQNDIGSKSGDMPPPDVNIGGKAIQLVTGSAYNCVLLDSGAVRCWGQAVHGALGYENNLDIGDFPVDMPPANVDIGEPVSQLIAGFYHICAHLESEAIRCWGYGGTGLLGYGNTSNIGDTSNEMPPGDVDIGGLAIQLTAGGSHTCALLDSGNVRCWGNGYSGQLGYGNQENIGDDPGEMPPEKDVDVGGKVIQIAAGGYHTCALLESGNVRCWGESLGGVLGYGNQENIGDEPGDMPPDNVDVGARVIQITAGDSHTCALLESGLVRCWGDGGNGALGYGNQENIGDDELPSSVGFVPIF